MTELINDSNNSSNDSAALITQDEFMKGCIIISGSDTKLPPKDKQCGICLEPCVVSSDKMPVTPVMEGRQEVQDVDSQTVVFLKPCKQCFFHKECICHWFDGLRPERNTCPNDRTELFVAKPLTKEQVEQREVDEFLDHYTPQDYEPGSASIFRVPGHEGFYCEEERYILRQVVAEVSSETDLASASKNENIMVDMLYLIIDRLQQRNGPFRSVFGPKGLPLLQYHVAFDLRMWLLQDRYRVHFSEASGHRLAGFHRNQEQIIGREQFGELTEEARLRGFFEAGASQALIHRDMRVVPVDRDFVDSTIRAGSVFSRTIRAGPISHNFFRMVKAVGMIDTRPARWLRHHWPSQDHRLARQRLREVQQVLQEFTVHNPFRISVT